MDVHHPSNRTNRIKIIAGRVGPVSRYLADIEVFSGIIYQWFELGRVRPVLGSNLDARNNIGLDSRCHVRLHPAVRFLLPVLHSAVFVECCCPEAGGIHGEVRFQTGYRQCR